MVYQDKTKTIMHGLSSRQWSEAKGGNKFTDCTTQTDRATKPFGLFLPGHAQADHTGGGCGAASFSALESGWVNVTTASCVEFGFSSPLPYRLDCFLLQRHGPVLTMLNRSRYESQEHLNYTVNFTLPPVVGKVRHSSLSVPPPLSLSLSLSHSCLLPPSSLSARPPSQRALNSPPTRLSKGH